MIHQDRGHSITLANREKLPRNPSRLLFTALTPLLLVLAVLSVYWQVAGHQFIEFDDQIYIFENPHVRTGLNWENFLWAFRAFYASNWHPLTWWSHMLDVQLFGFNPAGPHLVNVALHAANSVLLFLLLCRLTGAHWRATVVAALFALHPLHVESVAWVAERKDMLSTMFWMLTLFCYARYAGLRTIGSYLLTLAAFILGLMAKPMLVSLPLVMLLLDYWPLGRVEAWRRDWWRLLLEKMPFLLLAALSCLVTFFAQQSGESVTSLENSPLVGRIANALASYAIYLGKMLWPAKLAVFYPYDYDLPLWPSILAALLLIAVSILAFRQHRKRPYLLVGWLWYLITLLPVIGIVQVGLQAMADRYTYIPLTGIFIMAVWGLAEFAEKHAGCRRLLAPATALILAACMWTTWHQVPYWRDTTTLFTHALKVTRDNFMALCVLGRQQEREGRLEEALESFNRAVEIAPWYEYAQVHQGIILMNQGRLDAAIYKYNEAILQNFTSVTGHINLGIVMALQNRLEEAAYNFRVALDFSPNSEVAHYNMAMTLSKMGKYDEAVQHYLKALDLNP